MDRTGLERKFPPREMPLLTREIPTQRNASAYPGMTNFIVVRVLHADALDEFPKQRQELLDLGKGC